MIIFIVIAVLSLVDSKFVIKEFINNNDKSILKMNSLNKSINHRIMIAVTQKSLAKLEKFLIDRSDPTSHNYQRWLTYEEIGESSRQPTTQPSRQPLLQPASRPTRQPTSQPSVKPTTQPSRQPSSQPSSQPTRLPTSQPTSQPSRQPTRQPR